MTTFWKKAQEFEHGWWGDCLNTYGEEEKQLTYARKMGLTFFHNKKSPYNIDLQDKIVLDIGGGPTSLLLKCVNRRPGCRVVDPLPVPQWVKDRYEEANITYDPRKGEDAVFDPNFVWDEVWIYNCLQHTENPGKIIANARKAGKLVRMFEWVDAHTNDGHPHVLTEQKLNEWLGGVGRVEMLNHYTLRGKAYYGIFPTPLYTP